MTEFIRLNDAVVHIVNIINIANIVHVLNIVNMYVLVVYFFIPCMLNYEPTSGLLGPVFPRCRGTSRCIARACAGAWESAH